MATLLDRGARSFRVRDRRLVRHGSVTMAARSKQRPQDQAQTDVAEPVPAPCDGADGWFRSSDEVRRGFVRGIQQFDVRPVTYNVIDDLAIFEGDIVLGSAQDMEAIVEEVMAETAESVAEAVTETPPGVVERGVGITG